MNSPSDGDLRKGSTWLALWLRSLSPFAEARSWACYNQRGWQHHFLWAPPSRSLRPHSPLPKITRYLLQRMILVNSETEELKSELLSEVNISLPGENRARRGGGSDEHKYHFRNTLWCYPALSTFLEVCYCHAGDPQTAHTAPCPARH